VPRINWLELNEDEQNDPTFEPIRRSSEPVSDRHVNQRRAENGINRFRKARKAKENAR